MKKNALLIVAGLILAFSAGYLCHRPPAELQARTEVVTDTIRDTIPFYQPVPRDSVVLRYVTATLPLAQPNDTALAGNPMRDSAAVAVPISQTYYADSSYEAWVSGFQSKLDSIKLYPLTVTKTVTVYKPPNRWNIGITGGYGMTPKGFQPFIGVGVTYNIFGR